MKVKIQIGDKILFVTWKELENLHEKGIQYKFIIDLFINRQGGN